MLFHARIRLCVSSVLSSDSLMFLIIYIYIYIGGEFCSRVVLFKVCQLSHVSYSFLLVHYALMNYTYMWLRTKVMRMQNVIFFSLNL